MRVLVIALALALTGCGFKPMLATGPNDVAIGPVAIPEVTGKSGHVFRTELERLLDAERGEGPLRRIEVDLAETIGGLGYRVDESASRADLILTAQYRFYDAAGALLFSGVASATASYDISASAYAEVAAQNDARERAGQQLAEKVRTDLAIRLARLKPA